MKVCLLSKMYPPVMGGSGIYAYEIANALGARGHEVDVYTQSVDGDSMALPTDDNVTVHRICKARRYLVTFETLHYSLKARRGIDLDDYDVIHGTLMPASTIGLTPRLSNDPPIVVTSHGTSVGETLSHEPDVPTDYLKRYFFHPTNVVFDSIAGRTVDHIIGISSHTRDQLVSTYRFDESKVSLVPHGVDTDRFTPTVPLHSAVDPETFTLLYLGRLVSRKGIDLALEALAELDASEAELLVAGTGSHESRLREKASRLGIADQVTFLGFVPDDDLPSLYASADTFLFPSRYEGFGLTLLESMASGTPVIGTPVGGVPDVIEDGENGYVVDRSPDAMADRIDHLRRNPDDLDRISEAALETAREMTWDDVAAEVESVYEEVR